MRVASIAGFVALSCAAAVLLCAPMASAQPTTLQPQTVIGGLADAHLGGLSIARDGSGGLVFTTSLAGTEHVFVSRLLGGAFTTPQQLDIGLSGPSSEPVIAAGNGGVLLVSFVNGGNVYVTQTSAATAAFSAPQSVAGNAQNPSIALSNYGVGYLAYTVAAGGGDDVDVDYWTGTAWSPPAQPVMNDTPGDDAGVGAAAPQVAAAGDGVGIVAWGENGHVYSRRVWGDGTSIGTGTSTEIEQDDPASFDGWNEVTADSPVVAAGGDSSYVDIGFREELQNGNQTQERVLLTRLVAEDIQPAVAVDGLTTPGGRGPRIRRSR